MLIRFILSAFLTFLILGSLHGDQMSAVMLPSTEADPDTFIQRVNVINGDYCETALDLEIAGPDVLILQRYYNAKNYMTGKDFGGWRIFPQTLLVTGRDPQNKECKVGQDRFEWIYAFTGERSGGILSYSGWRKISGDTKDPLKIEMLKDTAGMVNSFAGEMSGQTNHLNNRMHFKQEICELILGDGTKRIYQKVKAVPTEIFGEEIAVNLAAKVAQAQYFLLVSETLPSGNVILFTYDEKGHIASVEMKDSFQKKTHSWIHFDYDFNSRGCFITVTTSDEKKLIYEFEKLTLGKQAVFILKEVKGNYGIPVSYDYEIKGPNCFLIKKRLPEGRFVEIEYDDGGRVKALKVPSPLSGKPETEYRFNYGDKFTDVANAAGIQTRYRYDDRFQLTTIEHLTQDGKLYRTDKKYYGKTRQDLSFLLARTISDATGRVHSYRCFKYDGRGNVLVEKLYGNLTGKQEVSLQVDIDGQIVNPDHEECHTKTYSYSEDGFNLLTHLGDSKGNKTTYTYDKGSNRLIKKLIYESNSIKRREFRFYNEDAVCTKIIEDDSSVDDIKNSYGATEKHITEITPKETLPGVGLPEVIEEKASDLKAKKEILVKKLVNIYSPQGQLLSCATYDSNGAHAFTVRKTYNHLGQVTSKTDAEGKITSYTYDGIGNQILVSIPHENKTIEKYYDYKNNLIQTVESAGILQKILQNTYDILGRKIASTDQFGQTYFEYDAFGHLTKVIHPTVLNEYEKIIQPTFSYTYDIFGNALSITDPKGYTTYKTYNLRGHPTKIHYPDGSVEMFKYDIEGSLHRSLTRDQIITVYEYDYLGRVSYEETSFGREKSKESFITGREYKYNGFRLLSLTNRYLDNNTYTLYRYDPAGRVTSITQLPYIPYDGNENLPQSRKTEIGYDFLGRESKRKVWFDFGSSDFSIECIEYDLLDNIIEKRIEDATGHIQLRKGFAYDSSGRCVEEYTCSNNEQQTIVKTAYDAFGEPILFTDALGNETKVIIDYGKNGPTKTIINSEGVQTKIEFDALGRTVSIVKKDTTEILLSSQSIFYDGVGNKSLEKNAVIADGNQLKIQKIRWVYGPMGRIEELIEAEGSPEEKKTAYSYNTLGKLVAKTLPGAIAPLAYTYTKQGWLSKIHYQEGKNALIVNNYTYDRRGNITSASALNNQSVERTYNIFNQIIQETVQDGEGKYTLKFQYDRKGRVKSIALPDGSSIAYTYDGVFGREVKRLSPRGEELYSHTYTSYDESGKLLEETLIGYCGERLTHYDLHGRKTLIETDYYTETVPANGYNTLGNLLTIQRKGDFPIENSSYTYNCLSQLTSEKNGIQKTYSYDSLDNRLKENKDELLYNNLNQLIAQAKTEFSYDSQGNLLRKTLDGEETQFESNMLSQLIAIEKPNHTYLTFSYDPFGRRVVKKTYDSKEKNKKTLSITRSFYLGFHELGVLNEKNTIKKLRVPGISGSQISFKSIAIEIEDQIYAVLHDISGNIIALLDPCSREVVESYTYSTFGTEKIYNANQKQISSSALGNPWRYAEKPIDEETGLIYFGFRYYDPSISRWISKDPAGFIDGPNLYAYCHNNPLRCYDPFGLDSQVNEKEFYGEVEEHCFCERHRTCKRGGDIGKTTNSLSPKIRYCESFESFFLIPGGKDLWASDFLQPEFNSSKIKSTGGWEIDDLIVAFTNGILNTPEKADENALYLSRLASGYNIHYVFNATHGSTGDFVEYLLGRNYIATEPVRLLHQMWNSVFETRSAAKILMYCHSQGVVHVRNALIDYPPELRERIIVIAIAPGAYVYSETCAYVLHYRNASLLRDCIPHLLDKKGAEREKDTIVDLVSHSDAGAWDHPFQSPTYKRYLIEHLKNFLRNQ